MAIECKTLLAVQTQDDQDKRDALHYAIEQQGHEDVDVLHVFDHNGRFIGRWVNAELLRTDEVNSLCMDQDTWHEHSWGSRWGWIAEVV